MYLFISHLISSSIPEKNHVSSIHFATLWEGEIMEGKGDKNLESLRGCQISLLVKFWKEAIVTRLSKCNWEELAYSMPQVTGLIKIEADGDPGTKA